MLMEIFRTIVGLLLAINLGLAVIAGYRSAYARQLMGLIAGIMLTIMLWGALMAIGLPIGTVGMFIYYGIILHAFFHYRHVRREELRYVLGVAAQAQSP